MKNNNTLKEANKIIDNIQDLIKSYLRKSGKNQVELYIALHAQQTSVRSRRTKEILRVLLEIMHEEVGGFPNPPQSDDAATGYGILEAEVIQ